VIVPASYHNFSVRFGAIIFHPSIMLPGFSYSIEPRPLVSMMVMMRMVTMMMMRWMRMRNLFWPHRACDIGFGMPLVESQFPYLVIWLPSVFGG